MSVYSSFKSKEGSGLKQIHIIGKSLVAKNLWNLFSKESLWKSIIFKKYTALSFLLDLIWIIRKVLRAFSITGKLWYQLSLLLVTFSLVRLVMCRV